jgi:hypothetical protein
LQNPARSRQCCLGYSKHMYTASGVCCLEVFVSSSREQSCVTVSIYSASQCVPPPPSVIKGNVSGGCFCLQSLPKRECEVSFIGSRRKSQLMQCIAVWYSMLQPVCSKNPTTKPLGCGSYFSGPLAGLYKSRRYGRDE